MPKVGEPLPLSLQLFDGATDKYVKALLRDSNGDPLPSSPVTLPHLNDGNYESGDILMPAVAYVTAIYQVFDDAGFTTPSADHSDATDVFPVVVLDDELIAYLIELKELLEQIINQGVQLTAGATMVEEYKLVIDEDVLIIQIEDSSINIVHDEDLINMVLSDDKINVYVDEDTINVNLIECN